MSYQAVQNSYEDRLKKPILDKILESFGFYVSRSYIVFGFDLDHPNGVQLIETGYKPEIGRLAYIYRIKEYDKLTIRKSFSIAKVSNFNIKSDLFKFASNRAKIRYNRGGI